MNAPAVSPRHRVFQVLENPNRADRLSWAVEIGLIVLILASVTAVALETVPELFARFHTEFRLFDLLITLAFTVEYIARVWAAPEDKPDKPAWLARLHYMRSPMAIIDLVAILPFYLALFMPLDLQLLRVLRLLRIYKLARYSPALTVLMSVIREEAATLLAAFSILTILLIFAAAGAYWVEHAAQPEAFGSVPAAMWWSMVTLTTVGYGDVTPITPMGRVFGGAITILGVGMAALPAGIIASGMADHLHRRRDRLREEFRCALEDGHIDLGEGRKIERLRRELGISREIAHGIHQDVRRKQFQRLQCTCPQCGHEFQHKGDDE
ncbi:ion transporter [Aquicoccus porphyridii]|uniref:Ion transporter n=1 Tax=Aquicoccus porphyridii TaxID=1852029 RepID=A0A5A9ZCI9_9RHOB|nr:ion transporter [Aquicoccus porphyridii]KAA0914675.1 ion transporter [Aquicoccus porphyridii]RAI53294.1 ion transporter [Rhodobacteraceae bacterium AsT-22]